MAKENRKAKRIRRKNPFGFVNMSSVVYLLHNFAPQWGQVATGIEEMPIFSGADIGKLPEELAIFCAAGGTLDGVADAAVNIFLQQARAFGQVGQAVRRGLFAQLRIKLGQILKEYRGGK
ncbi:MAG: hypothetical protein ISS87_02370 [Candidatus Pacebacteria bacterium]|nr:hypothetical protein [Candidatus Paceibacterota bacterium]